MERLISLSCCVENKNRLASRTNLSISLLQWAVLETNPEITQNLLPALNVATSLLGKKDGYQTQGDCHTNPLEAALTSYLLPDADQMADVD